MTLQDKVHPSDLDDELVESVFKSAELLAEKYDHSHYIYKAIDDEGIVGIVNRRKMFTIINDMINEHQSDDESRNGLENSDSKLFGIDREKLIAQARNKIPKYPNIDQFKRNWNT